MYFFFSIRCGNRKKKKTELLRAATMSRIFEVKFRKVGFNRNMGKKIHSFPKKPMTQKNKKKKSTQTNFVVRGVGFPFCFDFKIILYK